MQLLVVEDEVAHVAAIRRAFEVVGSSADIVSVDSLRGFREHVAACVPDLVLMDLNLPDGSALEMLTHPPENAPFPVLVMTAFGSQSIVVDVMKAGALDYLVKSPESFERLPRTVFGALREWRLLQDHRRAMEELRLSHDTLGGILNATLDGYWCVNKRGDLLDVNARYAQCSGYTREELLGMNLSDLDTQASAAFIEANVQRIMRNGGDLFEAVHRRKDGTTWNVEVSVTYSASVGGRFFVFLRDITLRRRAEAERENMQSLLTQAQKMESVGRLAGGVAHDFNNIMGAILGNVAFALLDTPPGSAIHESLEEIERCAHRSVDLTQQLLAFAHKQTVAPKVLDLNTRVANLLRMLRRLVGEDIVVAFLPAPELWRVKIDPSQVDQLLANLCVNARDAIAGVGKLTLETANVSFDEAHVAEHPDFAKGDFVRLVVSDNGCGMDKEAQTHLFEPFFTTKELGRGTGLGLATVYGIVRQNDGFITVHSEPLNGSSFSIFLPRHVDSAAQVQDVVPARASVHGHETILLVEDEPALLRVSRRMLEHLGYRVLPASTPGEAVRRAAEHDGPIHLLLTDVVMPEMNGRELSEQLQARHPGLKLLFASGYTADVIAHRGVLHEGIHFIQKPFTLAALAEKVRVAIEAG